MPTKVTTYDHSNECILPLFITVIVTKVVTMTVTAAVTPTNVPDPSTGSRQTLRK